MLTARCLAPVFGAAALLALTGCDLNIPLFYEDPTTLSEDRSEEAQQLDDRIRGDILSAFVEQEVGTLKNVTVDVYEENVLLTGTVTGKETIGSELGQWATRLLALVHDGWVIMSDGQVWWMNEPTKQVFDKGAICIPGFELHE